MKIDPIYVIALAAGFATIAVLDNQQPPPPAIQDTAPMAGRSLTVCRSCSEFRGELDEIANRLSNLEAIMVSEEDQRSVAPIATDQAWQGEARHIIWTTSDGCPPCRAFEAEDLPRIKRALPDFTWETNKVPFGTETVPSYVIYGPDGERYTHVGRLRLLALMRILNE